MPACGAQVQFGSPPPFRLSGAWEPQKPIPASVQTVESVQWGRSPSLFSLQSWVLWAQWGVSVAPGMGAQEAKPACAVCVLSS